jgi:hypothetical protein
MTKYREWMLKRSLGFIKEVHPSLIIPDNFKQERPKITLEQLKELDRRFINNPEGDIDGSTSD